MTIASSVPTDRPHRPVYPDHVLSAVDETFTARDCWTPSVAAPFSGRADVRWLTDQECVRKALLRLDFSTKFNEDDFDTLDSISDRSKKDVWECKSKATTCFRASDMGFVACKCQAEMSAVLSVEAFQKYVGPNGDNCGRRRLEDASRSSLWAEDSDSFPGREVSVAEGGRPTRFWTILDEADPLLEENGGGEGKVTM